MSHVPFGGHLQCTRSLIHVYCVEYDRNSGARCLERTSHSYDEYTREREKVQRDEQ
jgi:hypothetical protein